MSFYPKLSMDQVAIIQNMINLVDAIPVCADELLDCDMEVYNELGVLFECVVDEPEGDERG